MEERRNVYLVDIMNTKYSKITTKIRRCTKEVRETDRKSCRKTKWSGPYFYLIMMTKAIRNGLQIEKYQQT